MIVASHQPNFLPWCGFFYKALLADRVVLLDDVQFARGFSWVNRNRIKGDQGEVWLTVPVWKKGRGLQHIRNAEICHERSWSRKHLQSLYQHYLHAPYWEEHIDFFQEVYAHRWERLIDLNLKLIRYLAATLGVVEKFVLQSSLRIQGSGSALLVSICQELGADTYITSLPSAKFLDPEVFDSAGITVSFYRFVPPVYPQLWGPFLENLSYIDLLFDCGEKSRDVMLKLNAGLRHAPLARRR